MKFSLLKGNKTKDIENKFANFSEQLAQAFGQIKNDIESINSRLDSNQSEAERLGQWIGYLNRHSQRISDSNSKIIEKFEKIAENHHKLHTSHSQLVASHSDMFERTQNLEKSNEKLPGTIASNQEALRSELKDEFQGSLRNHKENHNQEIRRLKAWIDYFSTHVDGHKGKEDALKQNISKMEQNWSESYSKLRELVTGLRSENTELKSEIKSHVTDIKSEMDHARNELKNTILELETTKSELSTAKQAIQNTASELESTRNLAESLQKIPKSETLVQNQQIQAPISHEQTVVQPVSPTQSSFQRHIISRVMPNRKGYVLKFILDLIKENQHSTKEIEETVVNEKQLCGRTSFYAYLKELKLKGRISYAEIDERQILICTDSQTSLMERLDRLQ